MLRQQDIGNAELAYDGTPATYPAYEAAMKAAEIAHLRRCLASARGNSSVSPMIAHYVTALRGHGVKA
jgi:hypothetical protein